MSGVLAVIRKELTIYFSTAIFYITGFFFLVLGGYFFYSNLVYYSLLSFQGGQNPQLAALLNPHQMIFRPLFGTLAIVFIMMVPLLTMRLLAEEKRSGTAELLFTYPLTDWAVILGKFFSALLVYALLLLFTLSYALLFASLAKLDWGPILSSYLGLLLLGGACLSLGLFASSLTENQIIAAVIAFALLLLIWLIGWQAELDTSGLSGFFAALSMLEHFENFIKGVVDTRDLIYFLSFILFFLFLTKRQLESRHWRA
ncbi:MAG: ABC transporter permease [Deltaproteobacteria bacterium]|nr:ABC transporter permease [Deltaproteobacteria bacterium]